MEKKFSLKVIKLTLGVVFLCVALNFFIDPYNRFGMNTMGVYISAEREFKVTEISSFEPEWVLLGNSKSAMIDVTGVADDKVFNAGFGSASIEEMVQFIKEHIPNNNVKLVIGLDILQYSAGRPSAQPYFYVNTFDNVTQYLFSLKSLEYCGKTIGKYVRNKPKTLFENGSYNAIRWFEHRDVEDENRAAEEIKRIQQSYLDKPGYSKEMMKGYRELARIIEEKGLKAIYYLHPIHEEVMEFVKSKKHEDLKLWIAEIKTVFPEVINLSESEYSKSSCFFKTDPIHYYPKVGAEILKLILN